MARFLRVAEILDKEHTVMDTITTRQENMKILGNFYDSWEIRQLGIVTEELFITSCLRKHTNVC